MSHWGEMESRSDSVVEWEIRELLKIEVWRCLEKLKDLCLWTLGPENHPKLSGDLKACENFSGYYV